MNKNYIKIDDKIFITDEDGKISKMDYYDGIDEVLAQENIVEKIEKKIASLSKIKINSRYYKKLRLAYLAVGIIAPFLSYFLFNIMHTESIGIFSFNLESLKFSLIMSPVCLLIVSALYYVEYSKYIKERTRYLASMEQLSYLEKQLEIEKEKLNELTNEHNNKEEISQIKVDNEETKIVDNSVAIYNASINQDRFANYYKKGKLNDILQEYYYTKEQIEMTIDFLEEKGLILKKK